METKQGIITGIIRKRGFGFIRPNEGNEEIFFTATAVIEPEFEKLKEGMPVNYIIAEYMRDGEKQIKAIGIVAA